MKAIISDHLYDTKTATLLATWQNTNDTRDFQCEIDSLYRTKNGKFFLHEEGGAKTDRATRQVRSCGWGERIRLVTPEEALAWCSAKGQVEVALRHFGHLIKTA
jgi:hypothetical protein